MSELKFNPEWVEAARRGDQDAVTMLYSSTYSSVYYTIRSLIRYDDDTVMDLLQDTYVKAFTKLDSLNTDDNFPAWVKTIARNTTLGYLNKKKPLLFTETEDDEGNATWEPVDTDMNRIPEEVLDQADTEQIFKEILDSIPEKQRIVVSMYYYMEIKQADIARILGLSIGAVNTRLKLGVKSIEEKILAIEKRDGIRLHAIAPFTFFLFLLKKTDAKAMEPDMGILIHVTDAIKSGNSSINDTGDKNVTSSGETQLCNNSGAAAGKAFKTAIHSIAKGTVAKIIGGIALLVVLGGGAYVSATISSNNEETAKTESPAQSGNNAVDDDLPAVSETNAKNDSTEDYSENDEDNDSEEIPELENSSSPGETQETPTDKDDIDNDTSSSDSSTYSEDSSKGTDTITPARHAHSYKPETTRRATCDTNGIITYTCSSCGDTYTESTPATGHAWVHHDEEGHYETVVVEEAYTERNPIWKVVCNGCKEEFDTADEAGLHVMEAFGDECQNYASQIVDYETIEHPAVTEKVWVVDEKAYDECKNCKERR